MRPISRLSCEGKVYYFLPAVWIFIRVQASGYFPPSAVPFPLCLSEKIFGTEFPVDSVHDCDISASMRHSGKGKEECNPRYHILFLGDRELEKDVIELPGFCALATYGSYLLTGEPSR